jgi:hypothetical protein
MGIGSSADTSRGVTVSKNATGITARNRVHSLMWTHSIIFFAEPRSDFLFLDMAAIIFCLFVVEGHAYEK